MSFQKIVLFPKFNKVIESNTMTVYYSEPMNLVKDIISSFKLAASSNCIYSLIALLLCKPQRVRENTPTHIILISAK